jgi:hypothetical protein
METLRQKPQKADANFIHPFRSLITGKADSGKTFLAVKIMMTKRNDFDRLIVICPTWKTQDVFRNVDDMVIRSKDVYTTPDEDTFKQITNDLLNVRSKVKEHGLEDVRTLLFIDDLSGTKFIHGGRISAFAHLAIQIRHLGCSCILVSQQAKAVSPAYRDNINILCAFPSQRKEDIKWIESEYGRHDLKSSDMRSIIVAAWNGFGDESEWGKHFLFVYCNPRGPVEYFCDFDYRIEYNK